LKSEIDEFFWDNIFLQMTQVYYGTEEVVILIIECVTSNYNSFECIKILK